MSSWDRLIAWECDGRLPVLNGERRTCLTGEEAAAARLLADSYGVVLFRGFDLSADRFIQWTQQLGGVQGLTRMAPGATDPRGARIGLHTEDAMLSCIPAWIWFYAARPASHGGDTLLCDGAKVWLALSRTASTFLDSQDLLYWWRRSALPAASCRLGMSDPPGVERDYRGPKVTRLAGAVEVEAVCRPILVSRSGAMRVFGNHILNTIAHDDDGGPPTLDGFHRTRTVDKKPLPPSLLQELIAVTSTLSFRIQLLTQDVLWVDNTRFLHGRESFTGRRCIVVRKSYHPSQLASNPAVSSATPT